MKKIVFLLVWISACAIQSSAQHKTGNITGIVTTDDGKPVAEANIFIKELNKQTTSKENGRFEFHGIPYGHYTLIYSFAETSPVAVPVTVPPVENGVVKYQLPINARHMEEVIVKSRRRLNSGKVTAGKANIPIMDLPQSVTVIEAQTIANIQAQRLSDVVKNVNGVYLGTTRGNTQEAFYARGYSFGNNNMFKNGFRINSGAMPEMSSLESVEVLKGSAAVLYGNVAPGGILNMRTKKPRFDFGGEASMRTGSFDLYKPAIDIYGPITKDIAFRLNGTYETAGSSRDLVKSKKYYVNPSLLFSLGKKTTLLVLGDYLKNDFTPDFGIGTLGTYAATKTTPALSGTVIADVPRSRFMGTPWQYAHTTQSTVTAELNHQLSENWQLNIGASTQNYHRDYFSTERVQADSFGKWARPLGKNDTKENYYSAQANLTGKFSTGRINHNVLLGADADRYNTVTLTAGFPKPIYDTINILNPALYTRRIDMPDWYWNTKATVPVNRVGVYVQDLITITEKLKLLAGIRWSLINNEKAITDTLTKSTQKIAAAFTENAFSPRVGLVYQPNHNMSLFASYANSFTPNTGTDVNGSPLPSSVIDQYEIGIKNDLFDKKLSLNVTAYKIINSNLAITAPYLADGTTANNNTNIKQLSGQTTSNGVEVDVQGRPVNGLDVLAGYSYNDMRYSKTPKSTGTAVEGQRLVNTPQHTANASAFYTVQRGCLTNLKLGVNFNYTGDRLAGWNNTYNADGTINNRLFNVKGFSTADATIGYTYKQLSLIVKLANITNTNNYYVHENYSINPIPPRNFVATLAYRF